MAIFSNLEGTMKKTFILGKNGARLSTDGTEVEVQNYQGTAAVPVSAADPKKPQHLVTLAYFNAHGSGGAGGALSGTTVPDVSLGKNGDMYLQVDATDIIQIYFKDQDIWKPFKGTTPITDSDYVTQVVLAPADFISNGANYQASILETTHKRGINLLVQVQDPGGNTIGTEVTLDSMGNISVGIDEVPTTDLILKLIGTTNMTTPYDTLVNTIDWISTGTGKFTLSIPATQHGQAIGPLYLAVYENTVPGGTSAAPYAAVTVDSAIDVNGNVTFTAYDAFSGKVVISGK